MKMENSMLNFKNYVKISYKNFSHAAFTISLLKFISGCGSASTEELGRCKKVGTTSSYVASSTDNSGSGKPDPWVFEITAGAAAGDVKCSTKGLAGRIYVAGVIKDSIGSAKAGIAVGSLVSGENEDLKKNVELSETSTDSCGFVQVAVDWKCPDEEKTVEGNLLLFSGPLSAPSIKLRVHHEVAVTTVATGTGTTPAAPAAPVPAVPAAPAAPVAGGGGQQSSK
jgi:hypothetical protein